MPGSIAATVYGNRGGGWAPKPSKAPTPPKPKTDRPCRICGVALSVHPRDKCRSCFDNDSHHDETTRAECWAGRKRSATIRRDCGLNLNEADLEALRMPE